MFRVVRRRGVKTRDKKDTFCYKATCVLHLNIGWPDSSEATFPAAGTLEGIRRLDTLGNIKAAFCLGIPLFDPFFFRLIALKAAGGGGGYFDLNFRIVQPLQTSDVQIALFFFRELDVNRVDGLLSTLDGLGTSINSLPNAT